MTRCFHLPLIVYLMLGTAGCVFKDLQAELSEFDRTYAVLGRIEGGSSAVGPTIVILLEQTDDGHGVRDVVVSEATGDFSFLAPQGVYRLAAFEDTNSNMIVDRGEPSGVYGSPIIPGRPSDGGSPTGKDGSVSGLTLRLRPENDLRETFPELIGTSLFGAQSFVRLGSIARLDDPAFDQANGSLGYWKPATFLKNVGVGIYFLEPFDPHKIPVLFVHGAVGTPVGFAPIVQSMNQDRFQPWFFYYPSGVRLHLVVDALVETVAMLRNTYAFDKLVVAAHSMGGLVSRGFINAYTRSAPSADIISFISISTPWGGSRMAAKGAEQAPVAVPSWHDMAPDSTYIQGLFAQPLPEETPHYLFFGFKGDCSLFMANNDGTIELASELDYRAQRQASQCIGFDEDHMSILESRELIETYNHILDSIVQ